MYRGQLAIIDILLVIIWLELTMQMSRGTFIDPGIIVPHDLTLSSLPTSKEGGDHD